MLNRLAQGALMTLPCLLLAIAGSAPAAAQQPVPTRSRKGMAFMSESAMRRYTKSAVMPAYPEAALRDGVQGLAVALVTFDGEGVVVEVEILKAPDESIAEAVSDTLKRWRFTPSTHPSTMGRPTHGTLRFDFSIEDGKGRVQYGPLDGVCFQQPGHQMPDGTLRQRLEDIDKPCGK